MLWAPCFDSFHVTPAVTEYFGLIIIMLLGTFNSLNNKKKCIRGSLKVLNLARMTGEGGRAQRTRGCTLSHGACLPPRVSMPPETRVINPPATLHTPEESMFVFSHLKQLDVDLSLWQVPPHPRTPRGTRATASGFVFLVVFIGVFKSLFFFFLKNHN